ncbi:MAG: 50S ribosomal protein L17 [Fuerstiella sp.]|nr:50S ribosomal protein L17 [Fuerstiella sp.]MCP4507334.1 50S ribosomal protein L17 [Fuerstiella sp.]
MRHRLRGRKLGRNSSHRKAMFRNMAASLIKTVRVDEDDPHRPRVPGRIVTTVAKAKELRPFVEKLITLGKKAVAHEQAAADFASDAEKGTDAWRDWRNSDRWQQWSQTISPAVALRRRAFSLLRDDEAVSVLFEDLAERFADRDGGYTRIVRLSNVRLGDSGQQALVEFVGERDRVKSRRRSAPVVNDDPAPQQDEPVADDAAASDAEESPTTDADDKETTES